jgi:hypothetical protein
MSISALEIEIPRALSVSVANDTLSVDLSDGRTISVPLQWYPRLAHATAHELSQWRLIGDGDGIHWDAVDEDISIEGIVAGKQSAESQASLKKWLDGRSI